MRISSAGASMRPCRSCSSRSKRTQAIQGHIAFSPPATRIWGGSMRRERSSTGCGPLPPLLCRARDNCGAPSTASFSFRACSWRLARRSEPDPPARSDSLCQSTMTTSPVPPELLDAVVEYFRPLRVILFGSAARGDAGPDSDIDLFVILDDDAPPEKLTLAAGYQSRRSYHRATDVIPCREAVFRRKSRVAGTLAYTAAREGRIVYERR